MQINVKRRHPHKREHTLCSEQPSDEISYFHTYIEDKYEVLLEGHRIFLHHRVTLEVV